MADPNIQSITFPVSYQGSTTTYVADINKKTGAMDVYEQSPVVGNRFFVLKSYPGNNWKPELGPSALVPGNYDDAAKNIILTTVSNVANNQRAAYINKSFTQDQKNNLFPGMPRVVNTAPPASEITSGGTTVRGESTEQQTNYSEATENLGIINEVVPEKFGELRYPEKGSTTNGQDYIMFTVFQYLPQTQAENKLIFQEQNNFTGKIEKDQIEQPLGRIYLPVQPTIMDTNTVNWGEERFGILEMIGANLSLGAMGGNSAEELADKLANTVTSAEGNKIDPKIVSGVKAYLAKMAVSSNNNLMSRLTGAVTNPNLTLLFNSPDLRNFNFNFKLTPRTETEGTKVRQIIRVFKQYMAVQRTAANLFLEAPCIFKIRYIRGKDRFNKVDDLDHPSLNRIKTCALKSFSVNYTPAGSYMTYNDEAGTISSYDLTMSFTELSPVYWDDYNGIPKDHIGY